MNINILITSIAIEKYSTKNKSPRETNMQTVSLNEKIQIFRQLHEEGRLILANSWDVMSSRLAEQSGAKAIATTSSGISWSLGYLDNQLADRKLVMKALSLITGCTNLPVSADIEDGLLGIDENMDHLVQDLYSAECVGINIEDAQNGKSMSIEDGAERIAAVRISANKLNYNLFINARIDSWLRGENTEPAHLISRANAYLAAGADCIFIPGLTDLAICQTISTHINGPLNVMAHSGAPSAEEFFAAGVKRISGGSFFAEQAYGITLASMENFVRNGMLQPNDKAKLNYMALNALLAQKE
ncbi:isocitrate lyase/phosphoenolpyruvate mutase family protein [Xenorhabdus bovienii]|uniref:isocitrate lyase/PEP mutase family protein n=1 Tax=Xenorhabdus bovienii TaxID=40576 RepID=UPI001EDE6211|nr:isocitrate lyase/phosphoenolpyruvate mutase family protein [Xenorhabdus bovienii]MCG3463753.1 isocitrate lyase/phosphoenolpyruvate mutase family protein [Xenorhabdus bovienii]